MPENANRSTLTKLTRDCLDAQGEMSACKAAKLSTFNTEFLVTVSFTYVWARGAYQMVKWGHLIVC